MNIVIVIIIIIILVIKFYRLRDSVEVRRRAPPRAAPAVAQRIGFGTPAPRRPSPNGSVSVHRRVDGGAPTGECGCAIG